MGARRVLSPPPLRAAQKQNPEDQCGFSNKKNKKNALGAPPQTAQQPAKHKENTRRPVKIYV
jgi:hypothetical protein